MENVVRKLVLMKVNVFDNIYVSSVHVRIYYNIIMGYTFMINILIYSITFYSL